MAKDTWIQEGVRVQGTKGHAWAGLKGTVSHVVVIQKGAVARLVVVWDNFADQANYAQNVPGYAVEPLV